MRLLIKSGVVLVGVLAALVATSAIHVEPSIVALIGAGVLVTISGVESVPLPRQPRMGDVALFAGLFILVGSLVKTGVIADLARLAGDVTGGNPFWQRC